MIQYNYIKISYFFVFTRFFRKGRDHVSNVLKQLNSLDDRGIFCTEIHAKDEIYLQDSFAHAHNNIELIYSINANIDLKTDNEKFSLSAGELIVISPMEKHFQSIVGSGLYYSVKFLPSILFSSDQTFSEYKFFNQFISTHDKQRLYTKKDLESCSITPLFEDIMREWSKKDPGYELMIRANILKIFTALARCKSSDRGGAKDAYSNNTINSALAYIAENTSTVTERSVATHCGLSLAYFSTLFKNTVGMRFGEYLMQLKIGRAKSLLLTTDKSITYIAYETGFSSSSHFIARFRELEGITPASYRRRAQTEESAGKIKAPAFTAQFESVGEESGHLLVFKYRTNRLDTPPFMPIFLSTKRDFPISDDLSWVVLKTDEKWHVIITDMDRSKQYVKSFLPSTDGKFYGGHVHFHLFYKHRSPDRYIDLAYVAYAKDLDSALSAIGDSEDITLGFFEDEGLSRFEELPLPKIDHPTQGNALLTRYRSGKEIFSDASSNGISLRKVELLSDGNTEFTRIWSP